MAAGSCTVTEKKYPGVEVITFAWTSDASGNVTGVGTTANRYSGQAFELATVPGAGVSSYTISIADSNGNDILCGAGVTRSTSVEEYLKQASLGAVSDDTLTISITGAGSVKTGTAYLWLR